MNGKLTPVRQNIHALLSRFYRTLPSGNQPDIAISKAMIENGRGIPEELIHHVALVGSGYTLIRPARDDFARFILLIIDFRSG